MLTKLVNTLKTLFSSKEKPKKVFTGEWVSLFEVMEKNRR